MRSGQWGMELHEPDWSVARCARIGAMEREAMGEQAGQSTEAEIQTFRGRHTRSGSGAQKDRVQRIMEESQTRWPRDAVSPEGARCWACI